MLSIRLVQKHTSKTFNVLINVTCDFEKLEPDARKHICVEFLLNLSIIELDSLYAYVFRCFICFSAW